MSRSVHFSSSAERSGADPPVAGAVDARHPSLGSWDRDPKLSGGVSRSTSTEARAVEHRDPERVGRTKKPVASEFPSMVDDEPIRKPGMGPNDAEGPARPSRRSDVGVFAEIDPVGVVIREGGSDDAIAESISVKRHAPRDAFGEAMSRAKRPPFNDNLFQAAACVPDLRVNCATTILNGAPASAVLVLAHGPS